MQHFSKNKAPDNLCRALVNESKNENLLRGWLDNVTNTTAELRKSKSPVAGTKVQNYSELSLHAPFDFVRYSELIKSKA